MELGGAPTNQTKWRATKNNMKRHSRGLRHNRRLSHFAEKFHFQKQDEHIKSRTIATDSKRLGHSAPRGEHYKQKVFENTKIRWQKADGRCKRVTDSSKLKQRAPKSPNTPQDPQYPKGEKTKNTQIPPNTQKLPENARGRKNTEIAQGRR